MNIILLSGGSGKRLWPLSNDVRSKQFIKIFKNESGGYESMLQKMYRSIKKVDSGANITVATSRSQVPSIKNQIGGCVNISVEPCRRDTFPAIALATAYLHDVAGIGEGESVVVCPVDPYVDDDYFQALKELDSLAKNDRANMVLMGMEPTYPSTKYGYIIPDGNGQVSDVRTFKEKPDEETAKSYIAQGALWNGGVFAYKVGYMLKKAHELIDFDDYADLFSKYETLQKISFDYAVAEKEPDIAVMRFSGQWKDLGTWNTLTEAMEEHTIGDVVLSDDCQDVHVINNLGMPVFVMGMKDAVISACPDGIIVSDKIQSSYIKPYVDKMDHKVKVADKHWGNFLVLDADEMGMTVKMTMDAGQSVSYHSHERRDEVWVVVSGTGKIVVDGMQQTISTGDVITMQAGCRHSVEATTELCMIEIQLGSEIDDGDIKRFSEDI